MAASDARIFPLKNTAYRVTFPILDADGDLVTGATGLDSEVSQDGGAFADCTNEATEIATNSGMYYLDLTSGEMNGDTVALIVKTSSSGAKTTAMVFYPVETGDIDVDVTAFGGTAATTSGGRPEVNTTHAAGTAWGSGAITAASIAADAITAAKIADNAIDAGALAADCITAAKIADGAIDAATFAAGAITASAIAADAIGASELAADAVAEIQSGLATAAALATVDDFLDTEIADIQARLPAALVGGRIDANVGAISSDATAADNAEAFFDGTGYAGTNNVIPTVTTLTGHTPQTGDSFARLGAPAGASVSADIAAIEAQTDDIGVAGAGLTALASQASVDAVAAYVDTEVAAIKAKTDNLPTDPADASDILSATNAIAAAIAALNNLSAAQVNAEVVDALRTDTGTEVSAVPAAAAPIAAQLQLLYQALRNKIDVTGSAKEVHTDAGAVVGTKSLSDDGTTYSETKMA